MGERASETRREREDGVPESEGSGLTAAAHARLWGFGLGLVLFWGPVWAASRASAGGRGDRVWMQRRRREGGADDLTMGGNCGGCVWLWLWLWEVVGSCSG